MTDQTFQAVAEKPGSTAATAATQPRRRFNRSKNHRELSQRIARASGMLVTTRFSIPIYEREVTLNSLESQRVIESVYSRTMRSLYNIDVILRFIGDADDTAAIWKVIDDKIAAMRKSLNDEKARLQTVIEKAGVTQTLTYARPITELFKISSPSALDFIEAIVTLDEVIGLADRLWFARAMPRTDRFDLNARWQRRVEALGNTIFGIARRAMDSARRAGREAEIAPHLQPEDLSGVGASEPPQADGTAADKLDGEAPGTETPGVRTPTRRRPVDPVPTEKPASTVVGSHSSGDVDTSDHTEVAAAAE